MFEKYIYRLSADILAYHNCMLILVCSSSFLLTTSAHCINVPQEVVNSDSQQFSRAQSQNIPEQDVSIPQR